MKLWKDRKFQAILTSHRERLKCAALSLDNSSLATGSIYGRFALWDLELGVTVEVVSLPRKQNPVACESMSYTSDGRLMIGNNEGYALTIDCREPFNEPSQVTSLNAGQSATEER